jgi:ribosomal protein L37AE/L43A
MIRSAEALGQYGPERVAAYRRGMPPLVMHKKASHGYCEGCALYKDRHGAQAVKGWRCSDCRKVGQ